MEGNFAVETSCDRSLRCRYELKYQVSESEAAVIAEYIKPYAQLDTYCKMHPDGAYPIASLYLDTANLRLCRESLEGRKNRFKLRIRSYTDEQDYPCFFEIKRRLNTIIIKDRAKVMPAKVTEVLGMQCWSENGDRRTMGQFLLYMVSMGAKPIVRTRYQRQAFEGITGNKVRITFDRGLSYNVTNSPNVGLNGEGWRKLPMNMVVLEIKFTGQYPAWLGRMVKDLGLRQQSLSKYVHSVKQAAALGLLDV